LTNDDCRDQHPLSVNASLWRQVCTDAGQRIESISETLEHCPQHWHCKDRVRVWLQLWLGYRFGTGTNLPLGTVFAGNTGLVVACLACLVGGVGFGMAANVAFA